MLRIAICDDEEQFRKIIQKNVEEYLKKQKITFQIDKIGSGAELVELEEKMSRYDMVFLDISMGEIDGITAAQKLREYSSKAIIVFITAYMDYSLEGYKVNALRYLLKSSRNLEADIEECMETALNEINYITPKKVFKFREEEKEIKLDNVVYIESKLHVLEFHMEKNSDKLYTMYGILNMLEDELKEYRFVRIHQSYLVNLKHVKGMNKGTIILKDGITLTVPRVRCKEVEKAVAAYKGEE